MKKGFPIMAGKEKWCHNKSSWHFETENVPGKNKEEESLVLRKSGELLWHYDVRYLLEKCRIETLLG